MQESFKSRCEHLKNSKYFFTKFWIAAPSKTKYTLMDVFIIHNTLKPLILEISKTLSINWLRHTKALKYRFENSENVTFFSRQTFRNFMFTTPSITAILCPRLSWHSTWPCWVSKEITTKSARRFSMTSCGRK